MCPPPSSLDLSEAVRLFQTGQGVQALALCEQTLNEHPDDFDALHLSGVIRYQNGETQEGITQIEKALAVNPNHPAAQFNLGRMYQEQGMLDLATERFTAVTQLQPKDAESLFRIATIQFQQQRFDRAGETVKQALAAAPRRADLWQLRGAALTQLGRIDEAIIAYERAMSLAPEFVDAYLSCGILLNHLGRSVDAEAVLTKAIAIEPQLGQAHTLLAHAVYAQGRVEESVTHYSEALQLDANQADAVIQRAVALSILGRREEAVAAYREGIERFPDVPDMYGNLASSLEAMNRLDEAREVSERGLARFPDDAGIRLAAAKCDRRSNRPLDGIARLEPIQTQELSFDQERAVHFELGRLYDRAGDAADAFAAFTKANDLTARWLQRARPGPNTFIKTVDTLLAAFTEDWIKTWTPPSETAAEIPAFLVGFPRCGTTLLERVLDAHSQVRTIEEQTTIDEVRKIVTALPDGYPRALAGLDAAQLDGLCQQYWDIANNIVPAGTDGGLLIDKMPLNSVHAGLIHRVFPEAKFIFAVRHPCDVVLSCIMQDFWLNESMANFLSLESTVALYDKAMRLWQRYTELLPMSVHLIRYEDVIENFDHEISALLGFLDLEWEDDVRAFFERGERREMITTPSYHQVTKPLYRSSIGRWQRYREQLAPYLERLQPHIEAFGYDA